MSVRTQGPRRSGFRRATALPVRRAREELRAARALLEAGFPSQALSRAYLAAFHAASAALLALGEAPATRAGVVSAFHRRVVARGVPYDVGRALRRSFDNRNDVDYGLVEAPPDEARAAIADAESVVEAVADWLDHRFSGAEGPAREA